MVEPHSITNGGYTYIHDVDKGPIEAIDTHHVIARRNAAKSVIFNLSSLILIASPLFLFFVKDKLAIALLWSLILCAFFVKLFFQKPVEKGDLIILGLNVSESIIIMPAFGVQLETHYRSGRIIRRFIPISKILKAVVNECVTPVTCYWTLSLIVRGEEELTLVFKEFCPPLKLLVPIWKALCAAIDRTDDTDAFTQEGSGS
ncbi:hypothetical protein RJ639_042803 [Escallonia herrerae]|uniref:Phosphatidylinositol N-acetylglucosaminyltransferase subunit H conserved domain-containing protein n=1 Tax=Escallonia herrerae TaxID=1293975 RepID=A0AA89B169_9ASTE|nr:hypothetical protein RJ639_042803 [Escallonia herrerae]